MVPREAASKQSSGGMIWPPGKTSIRNRPPLISSTTFASRWAAPWSMSSAGVQAVDIRHWTFGCAMTWGASARAAAAVAATMPPAFTMNLRRSVVMRTPSLGLRGAMRWVWGQTPGWEGAERRKSAQTRAGFVASIAVTGPKTPRRYLGTSVGRFRGSIGGMPTNVNQHPRLAV